MADNRRQFLRRSGMLLGGAASLSPLTPAFAARTSARAAPRAGRVNEFFRRCGIKTYLLRGGSVLGTTSSPVRTDILAVAGDPAAVFARAITAMPFENPYADGNSLSFSDGMSHYKVEFATKPGLASLRSSLAEGVGVRFAHQALLQVNGEKAVFDPMGVLVGDSRQLRLVGKTEASTADRVATVLTGCVDSALYRLPFSAAFEAFQSSVLSGLPGTDAEAAAIADETTASVAMLACHAPASLRRLLTSPLISSSLQQTFGRTGQQIAEAAAEQPIPSTCSPAAPWLAAILGTERLAITQGSVWIDDNDRFSYIQSKAALVHARELTVSNH